MKKNTLNILFAVTLVGLFTASCKKYLTTDSPSVLTQESIFSSVSNMNSAVIGIYAMLIGDNSYGSRVATLFPQSADDMRTSGDFSATDRRGISCYGASPDNTDLKEPFNQLFKGIERANICIKYIPKSDLYINGTDAQKATLQKLYGEALTLRAQFFYEVIRNWGDMPAQFEPSADVTNLYMPRVSTDVLYDQLLDDLKIAGDLVPWRTQSPDQNIRITKGAVKGLRARIALARGGYSLRNDTHLNERRADYKKYYQIAYDECKEVIAHPEQHSLNPVYENIFKTLHTAKRFDDAHELMFEVGAFGSNASTDSKLGYYNGLRHNGNSKFGQGGGGINILPTYFYEFDSIADCRRDVTINMFEIDADSKKVMNTATTMTDGKFRRSWTSIVDASQNLAINWPILRFADVLLMYAEADNELNNGPSADAITAYEKVRKRAYVGYESQIGTTPTDKDGFFTAIVKERLLEFGGEGIRKYDLIRWNMLGSKITETRQKLRDFKDGVGRYANLPLYVYSKAAPYNVAASTEELKTLDLINNESVYKALFTPGLGVTPTPDKAYVLKNWRAAVNEDYLTGDVKGYAIKFKPNERELFPIPTHAVNSNYNMVQNNGY
ncbi:MULTISPECIES: RagB/SusD family nutrient uptake outer membrane protein [Niastella]|uniref:RagB/SusD family nutrient uptake outer membrane protein n=1 Tax=Niastella soli TaxID=2821487 RepID=A0ABS3YLM9_9BACT|nr:RagB/SusD family nutrient uptake outer membrane protein [Niastella soli]MBO9198794.1 RagB/SusD family nutrient uptake outer membrane protein [Niastella soli]